MSGILTKKLYYLVDKNGKNVVMDEYYSCLRHEDGYRTTFDDLDTAKGWVEWAIKHNNFDSEVKQPISIVELEIATKNHIYYSEEKMKWSVE